MKLCLIYNYAQHYRASIFKLISDVFDCDFVFGDSMDDVKKLDYTILRGGVTETHTIKLSGGWYWQPGVLSKLWQPYTHYILLGETRSLSTWLFCLLSRAFCHKKKVYFWSHGWYGKESRMETFVKKILFKLPNGGIFLYGNYARDLMINKGFNPDRLYTIHNSLAYEEQVKVRKSLTVNSMYMDHFGNNNPNLFFVGRLTAVKKLDMILKAVAKLKAEGQDYNVTFIGGGNVKDDLTTMTIELGLKDNVWFYGPCYDEKLLGEMIYNADLCVSPGNIGLTAMHTLVFGTPAITHDDFPHQMPEFEAIKDNVTGTFFKTDSVDSLAEGIARWFEKHDKDRENVRISCMKEIDENWTPQFQIDVLRKNLN